VPGKLVEDLGSPPQQPQFSGSSYSTPYPQRGGFRKPGAEEGERHYSYEDESQESNPNTGARAAARAAVGLRPGSGSLDNVANFFATRGGAPAGNKFSRPKLDIPAPTGKTGLQKGSKVNHPKYGEGIVFLREGDGDDAKITVNFSRHGVKKLVEKFAQLQVL
jgi:DNA helicase-2/ATP-dependent DNA helicase PcrA